MGKTPSRKSLTGRSFPSNVDQQLGYSLFSYLGIGDLGFAWIAVLGDEVTIETGEVLIRHFLPRTLITGDRFAHARKVICWIITRLLTGGYGLQGRVFKAAPLLVSEQAFEGAIIRYRRMVMKLDKQLPIGERQEKHLRI